MQPLRTLFVFLLLASTSLAQYLPASVEVEQFVAITAKSVRTESLADSVAVFLTDRDATERTGAFLKITSAAKWATPYSSDVGVSLSQSKSTAGTWLLFAKPGKYKVLIIEFDPDKGPLLSDVEVKIGKAPDKPADPPASDFGSLVNVVKVTADKINDQPTRTALKSSMLSLLPTLSGKSYDEIRSAVISSRQAIFLTRQGNSRLADWDSWRVAVDAELKRVVDAGDAATYLAAIAAIASAL